MDTKYFYKNIFYKGFLFLRLVVFFIKESKMLRQSEVVFFFPHYHIGGAEKIHLQIVTSVKDFNLFTIFTKQSKSKSFLSEFKSVSNCSTIFEFVKHEGFIKRQFIKRLTKILNTNKRLNSVFGCNTEFYYKILPLLNSNIKKIDLTHAFSFPDYGLEQFSIPYIEYLDKRVVINKKTQNDFKNIYNEFSIQAKYLKNIIIINNGIEIKKNNSKINLNENFNIGFLGRWSSEKQPEIFLDISKKVTSVNNRIKFIMAGTQMEAKEEQIKNFGINFLGILNSKESKESFFNSINVLVITSYREGLPLVLMEAMSYGVVVISTDVGSVNEHIINGVTGYLVKNSSDSGFIVKAMSEKILILYKNIDLQTKMSQQSKNHATLHFGIENFTKSYKKLLIDE